MSWDMVGLIPWPEHGRSHEVGCSRLEAASSEARNGEGPHAPAAPSCPPVLPSAPPRPRPTATPPPREPLGDTMACFYGNYEHGKNKCMHL